LFGFYSNEGAALHSYAGVLGVVWHLLVLIPLATREVLAAGNAPGRFTFPKYPDHGIGIYSSDLGDYLESLSGGTAPVVFRVSYHLWTMSGFQEIQIGELPHWRAESSYFRAGGNGPSPWDD
jgi:hypothetical protein